MNFIVKSFFIYSNFDFILIMIDKLSKSCHFILLKEMYTIEQIAKLFYKNIFFYHDIAVTLISDCSSVFIGQFWTLLYKLFGMKLSMLTTFHPQINR